MDSTMSRREVLRGLGAAAIAGAAGSAFAAEAPPRRPNFVFILVDDLRHDAFSYAGHPFMRTPHLDRLRAEGALFKEAFVTISLCSPSRACFLTGTYSHRNGVLRNDGSELDPARTPTFPMVLRKAGYATAYIGKWHQAGRSDPRPGFDHWLSFRGQGVYDDPELNENGRVFKAKGYMTDLLTDAAVKWIKEVRDKGKPFCLCLAHKAVHGPFTPAERHRGLYADAKMRKPESWDDAMEGKPAWKRAAAGGIGRNAARRQPVEPPPPKLAPAPWDEAAPARLNYFRSLQAVDDSVGRVTEALREAGILDDTVVIFTSDNGFFHGEHRRGDKRLAYEESIRIPMLMRYPRLAKAGGTVEGIALNIDVMPTLLELAGVEAPKIVQGKSLLPLLAGKADEQGGWRKSFLYTYWLDMTPTIPTMVAVRDARWKYVRYPTVQDLDELYDLQADPKELRNLAQDPAHAEQKRRMVAELERLIAETGYQVEPEPPPDGKPLGVMLDVRLDGGKPTDASGKKGTLKVDGAIAAGEGSKAGVAAMRFTGREAIAVERSAATDPSGAAWTVEAWVRAEGDGVIVAHGGATRGYLLGIDGGRASFLVRSGSESKAVRSDAAVAGRWVHLVATVSGRQATLDVDGKRAGAAQLAEPIGRAPNDGLSIGRDLGSPVEPELSKKGFAGLIERIVARRGPAGH